MPQNRGVRAGLMRILTTEEIKLPRDRYKEVSARFTGEPSRLLTKGDTEQLGQELSYLKNQIDMREKLTKAHGTLSAPACFLD